MHGTNTLCQQSVRSWVRRFDDDPDSSCLDRPRCGGPRKARNAAMINKIKVLLAVDRHFTMRGVAAQCGVSTGSVHNILKKDLGLTKIAAKFVPKILSEEQCQKHVEAAQKCTDMVADDPTVLQQIVTSDESSIYSYDPETKHKSQEWVSRVQGRPTKALRGCSQKKTMLVAFFDDAGVIHFEFVQGTVNRFVYCQILGHEAVRKRRPTMWAAPPGDSDRRHQLYLHQDNAPAHNALMTQARLMECGIDLLPHPAYSPDLFPRLKRELRGRRFANLAALQGEVAHILIDDITPNEYEKAILELPDHWCKCVLADGQYFEGIRKLRPDNPQVDQ